MEFHGFPWTSMDFHGLPWTSMDFHGFPWKSMEVHGLAWTSMDFQRKSNDHPPKSIGILSDYHNHHNPRFGSETLISLPLDYRFGHAQSETFVFPDPRVQSSWYGKTTHTHTHTHTHKHALAVR